MIIAAFLFKNLTQYRNTVYTMVIYQNLQIKSIMEKNKTSSQTLVDLKKHEQLYSRSLYNQQNKYIPKLSIRQTEKAIKQIKWAFQNLFGSSLNLQRVSAPLYLQTHSGLNDGLSGVQRPVSFQFKNGTQAQIIHSLAKWKRMTLKKYGYEPHVGLYTDMNATRRDQDLSPIHSYYVDQWDWQMIIKKEERTVDKLKEIVTKIYKSIKGLEDFVVEKYPMITKKLGEEITFVTTQQLEDMYPNLTPKQREDQICRRHKAVFLMQVGKILKSGKIHDARAPDYDDWDLNGDILVYYEPLDMSLQLSSMGIRVDAKSLDYQLKVMKKQSDINFQYHKMISKDELPFTIGGGIGQSRLCMFMLDKLHVGEVQVSIWSKQIEELCSRYGISLL